jgi:hypothetical protein
MQWHLGKVIAGYGVASGRAIDSPYPDGTIRMQSPHFLQHGIDLSMFYAGTLNVDLAPLEPAPANVIFDRSLQWYGDLAERFLLSPVTLQFAKREYRGLWYYPHPETKPAHTQRDSVVELLMPWVEGLQPNAAVLVRFD